MKIQIQYGLPIVTVSLAYKGKQLLLDDVLLDTGCSTTIFDTDEVEEVGLIIDRKGGRPRRMYGVGGESELCYEQTVTNLEIDGFMLDSFQIQLGITKETYGFNGILGVDFMIKAGLIIDFNEKVAIRK
ncbi:retropepsin-like domain-containing protein [Fodinisporobacter ferrooxydans]|uniref:Retropepsin-like domain-containing protein n=1 Tax=Fodinisporobacter ferrooxydans TaxID=2901836 RepID=A0ABY4CQP3_9BACL|nr:retropepsin-like domain-containing protein [Alicyclobacillaceae bacterium MYW30-H2]